MTEQHEQLAELAAMYVSESVFTLPQDGTVECDLHDYHSPEVTTFDVHHVIPMSRGGPDTPENKVIVCPTGHRNVHTLIRLLDRIGKDAVNENDWGQTTWETAVKGWEG